MSDEEFLANLKNIDNEKLIQSLQNCGHDGYYNDLYYPIIEEIKRRLSLYPSAEPEVEVFEWCHDCKEYDQNKHCCHRWTKVIRQTVEEMRSQQPERKKGEWTEYKKSFGVYGQIYYQHDCYPNLYESPYHFCPNCGAEMESKR